MLEKITKNNTFVTGIILLGFFIFILSFIIFSWHQSFNLSDAADSSRLGQLGDFIGGIAGTLWAFVGVLLFYKALTDQKEDFRKNRESVDLQVKALNNQIDEFKATREEQRLARKAYEEQVKTAQYQQFDNSFFSMLQIYSKAKDELETKKPFPQQFAEIEAIDYDYATLKSYKASWPIVTEKFINLSKFDKEKLYPYYRSFYRLMRFIELSKILCEEDKYHYAKVVRSQVTECESLILFLNSFTEAGANSRSLIIKYNILKHISINDISKIVTKNEIENNLLIFINSIDKFLIEHLPKNYDIENTKTEFQENIPYLDIIVGIDFSTSDRIIFTIYTGKSLTEHRLTVCDEEFFTTIKNHLIFRMSLQKYMASDRININHHLVSFTDRKDFCFTITTNENAALLEDKI